jgi:hypothetical protein
MLTFASNWRKKVNINQIAECPFRSQAAASLLADRLAQARFRNNYAARSADLAAYRGVIWWGSATHLYQREGILEKV